MRNRQEPETGGFYRHFKGGLYQVRCMATHSESGEEMVVYQAMYPPYQTWVRPLGLFMGPVDHDKYPGVQQEWRFVRVDPEQMMPVDTERANAVMRDAGEDIVSQNAASRDKTAQDIASRSERTLRIQEEPAEGTETVSESENPDADAAVQDVSEDIADEELKQAILSGKAQEILAGRVSDEELAKRGFMMILDAGTSREKRALVIGLQKVLTPLQMSNLAVALDIVLPDGTRQEKLDSLIHCLGTLEKYECRRLR